MTFFASDIGDGIYLAFLAQYVLPVVAAIAVIVVVAFLIRWLVRRVWPRAEPKEQVYYRRK